MRVKGISILGVLIRKRHYCGPCWGMKHLQKISSDLRDGVEVPEIFCLHLGFDVVIDSFVC